MIIKIELTDEEYQELKNISEYFGLSESDSLKKGIKMLVAISKNIAFRGRLK